MTARDDLDVALATIKRALSAARSVDVAPCGWPWVRCGRDFTARQARAHAARGELRLTRIGKYLYAHRDDLDALAERGRVVVEKHDDKGADALAGVDPAIAAAFMRAAKGAP